MNILQSIQSTRKKHFGVDKKPTNYREEIDTILFHYSLVPVVISKVISIVLLRKSDATLKLDRKVYSEKNLLVYLLLDSLNCMYELFVILHSISLFTQSRKYFLSLADVRHRILVVLV